jgi:SSS family transporter
VLRGGRVAMPGRATAMTLLDWAVLIGTITAIVAWGLWKTRGGMSAQGFLRGDDLRWPTIGLSVMATQASAITFLSVPGQAYDDGMRFIQLYFGMPLAIIVVSAFFVPRFFQEKVFTAYELLEARFDTKTRVLGALLFLVQRGLAAGITIYAPAIILSTLLGWALEPTVVAIGGIVILYTVTGGARAVSQTQKQQMVVMLGGMAIAAGVTIQLLPDDVSVGDAVDVAGALGRLNLVETSFDPNSRYTLWSGLTGGFFLALSYFGTDQSQVGRYLTATSTAESRLGLIFNALFKIPMQAGILFVGVLVFCVHQFTAAPLLFNETLLARTAQTAQAPALATVQAEFDVLQRDKEQAARAWLAARGTSSAEAARATLRAHEHETRATRQRARAIVQQALPGVETRDVDYIFIGFVKRAFPAGLIGLLIAVILSAAMSSTASELSALGTTTTLDIFRRVIRPQTTDHEVVRISRVFTVVWGVIAIAFASFAALLDNLIQAVNILGSLFYGTVLGIFLVAFFVRRVGGHAVFAGALAAQALVIGLYWTTDIGYLWFNAIGCGGVLFFGVLLSFVWPRPPEGGAALSP